MDSATAKQLGLYTAADDLAKEKVTVEERLAQFEIDLPRIPESVSIRADAARACTHLEEVLSGATLEEKRFLITSYIKTIQADPNSREVRIGLYSPLFTSEVAGGRYTKHLQGRLLAGEALRGVFWAVFRRAA